MRKGQQPPWIVPDGLWERSGMTCWRRLHDWHAAGVWQRLHEFLLAELQGADRLDWSRAVIDSSQVRALKGGPKPVGARSAAPRMQRMHPHGPV
jgi:transposase